MEGQTQSGLTQPRARTGGVSDVGESRRDRLHARRPTVRKKSEHPSIAWRAGPPRLRTRAYCRRRDPRTARSTHRGSAIRDCEHSPVSHFLCPHFREIAAAQPLEHRTTAKSRQGRVGPPILGGRTASPGRVRMCANKVVARARSSPIPAQEPFTGIRVSPLAHTRFASLRGWR